MTISSEYVFDGPKEKVWELLQDPEVLSSALPGTKQITQVGENEYEGEMKIKVGPVIGVFSGRITVSDVVDLESYTLTVEGRGKAGFLNGRGRINFEDQGDGKTLVVYTGEVQVGGRLASVAQRLIELTSKSIIRHGLQKINKNYVTAEE